jgi:hypothetical protein
MQHDPSLCDRWRDQGAEPFARKMLRERPRDRLFILNEEDAGSHSCSVAALP